MSQATVSLMNAEIRAAIEAFAKSRKISPNACLQAAAMALAMQPYEGEDEAPITTGTASAQAAVATTSGKPAASAPATPAKEKAKRPAVRREANAKSLEFREAVMKKADELKGKRHTFAEVAKMFDIDPPNAVNNLRWLQNHKKLNFQVVGYATKQQGQKGRAPAIIEFA